MNLGNKPVAGALLACVPLGALSASLVSAEKGGSGEVKSRSKSVGRPAAFERFKKRGATEKKYRSADVGKKDEVAGSWKKTSLLDAESNVDPERTSTGSDVKSSLSSKGLGRRKTSLTDGAGPARELFKDLIKGKENNGMDDSLKDFFEALKSGDVGKGGDVDKEGTANIEGSIRKFFEGVSKSNVIDDVSCFNVDNGKVALSTSNFGVEKRELADAFLEAKRLGLYDMDWSVNPVGGVVDDRKADVAAPDKLADNFSSVGIAASAGLANFFTVKDVASGEILGQISFTFDPDKEGVIMLGAWAKEKDELCEALGLAFKGLSKNYPVIKKVSVKTIDNSGEQIGNVLREVAKSKAERFKAFKVSDHESHMEVVRSKDGKKYMLLEYVLESVGGKVVKLKKENVKVTDVTSNLEGAKKMISRTRELFSGFSKDGGSTKFSPADSGLSEILGCDVEVVDSFVVCSTDYEFTEE